MKNLLLAAALSSLASCIAPNIEATPFYGFSEFSGDFAISNAGITGTTSMEDLNLDDQEGLPGARVDFKWGSPHLSVSVAQTSSDGSGTTAVDLIQGGTTITAGTNVDSEIDLTYGNAIITFDVLPTDNFELGIGLGVEAADFETRVRESVGANEVSTDEAVPIPVVAVRAALELGPVVVDGLIAGMSIDYSGDELTFFDLDLRARWQVWDHGHVLVGYHRWDLDLDYEDGSDNVELELVADGPYFGIVFAF